MSRSKGVAQSSPMLMTFATHQWFTGQHAEISQLSHALAKLDPTRRSHSIFLRIKKGVSTGWLMLVSFCASHALTFPNTSACGSIRQTVEIAARSMRHEVCRLPAHYRRLAMTENAYMTPSTRRVSHNVNRKILRDSRNAGYPIACSGSPRLRR